MVNQRLRAVSAGEPLPHFRGGACDFFVTNDDFQCGLTEVCSRVWGPRYAYTRRIGGSLHLDWGGGLLSPHTGLYSATGTSSAEVVCDEDVVSGGRSDQDLLNCKGTGRLCPV